MAVAGKSAVPRSLTWCWTCAIALCSAAPQAASSFCLAEGGGSTRYRDLSIGLVGCRAAMRFNSVRIDGRS